MLGDLWDSISGWLGENLSSLLESILNATIFRLFYHLERGLCYIIELLYKMFEVFAGLVRVKYNNTPDYLINIFFSNKAVNNIYWAMALVGIALTIGFTIFAVVRKMFDSSGKQQQSHGQILWAAIRSILIIVGMTAIMTVVLNTTGVLMQLVNDMFEDPYHTSDPIEREFTGEEYAAMGRILSTIGNYSVVDSENNRYNLNLCFNDIRSDMLYLQNQGVFNYNYIRPDQDGGYEETWQSVLAQIATSCDLKQDVKADIYNDGVARSIRNAMNFISNNARPAALEKITRVSVKSKEDGRLDRMVFLMGTMKAAKASVFNEAPRFDDALRGPYFYGDKKSIYDFDQVEADFNIGFPTDYLVVWIAAVGIIINLVVIILNCVARLFNMLFLYLIAPPIIAATPLDGGGKTKQWMTAFIVQSLSVFGTVIAMRLLLLFVPIIIDPQLVLFENQPALNAIAKYMLVFGGFEAAKKSSSILTGILADSAGWQAIQAGDMSGTAMRAIGTATGAAIAGAKVGASVAGSVAGTATRPLTNLAKRPFNALAKHWNALGTGKASTEKGQIQEQIEREKKVEDARKSAGIGQYSGQGGSGHGRPGSQPHNQHNQPNNPQNRPNNPQNRPNNQNDPANRHNQPGPVNNRQPNAPQNADQPAGPQQGQPANLQQQGQPANLQQQGQPPAQQAPAQNANAPVQNQQNNMQGQQGQRYPVPPNLQNLFGPDPAPQQNQPGVQQNQNGMQQNQPGPQQNQPGMQQNNMQGQHNPVPQNLQNLFVPDPAPQQNNQQGFGQNQNGPQQNRQNNMQGQQGQRNPVPQNLQNLFVPDPAPQQNQPGPQQNQNGPQQNQQNPQGQRNPVPPNLQNLFGPDPAPQQNQNVPQQNQNAPQQNQNVQGPVQPANNPMPVNHAQRPPQIPRNRH